MNSVLKKISEKPILLLIAVNIIVGLFIFRNYGYSWDEPLFYDYGNALGYAYSPREWFSGTFDVDNSYGASGDDHKTRGPAYLFLSRAPVYFLESLGLDQASAWHLINFLFFQLGVYFLYRLSRRWMSPYAALSASALFSWQPMLWGHAFINPKDPPFLTFFLASVCLGFEMVDRITSNKQRLSAVFFPAITLGMTTSIRVLGPLAGLLVLFYFILIVFSNKNLRVLSSPLGTVAPPAPRSGREPVGARRPPAGAGAWLNFLAYGMGAVLAMFLTWPYLWESPITRFLDVFRLMSDNPTTLSVLFGGEIYRAGELPRRYLPFMLATTLTEPVWFLFGTGIITSYWRLMTTKFSPPSGANLGERSRPRPGWPVPGSADSKVISPPHEELFPSTDSLERVDQKIISLTLVLLWLVILVTYVLIRKPAMYDGIRHFLFILPPIFIFAGFAFEFIFSYTQRRQSTWLYAGLSFLILLPGFLGIARLHPYEYTYYNSFIGGTGNAFRKYETDFWLTCYKEAVQQLNQSDEPMNLFVHREAYIAGYYTDPNINVRERREATNEVQSGDYILVNTRTNEDRRILRDVPPTIQIGRGAALFCMIKRVP